VEISPEMVRDGILAIMQKHQDMPDAGYYGIDIDKVRLATELTYHAYSFAELPRPVFKEKTDGVS
jgi:hypothetical protein